MGEYLDVVHAEFEIKAGNKTGALEAIKNIETPGGFVRSDYKAASTLEKALEIWRWDAETNDDGDITNVEFFKEKLGDEHILFDAIAPFVTEGSYIEYRLGDGGLYRWAFDGKKLLKQVPEITWPAIEDEEDEDEEDTPREYTDEEVTDLFMSRLSAMVYYWASLPGKTVTEQLEGLLFSFLSMLDGCAGSMPAWIIAPLPHPEDKDYCIENGENWYPENHEVENSLKGVVPGYLHELLGNYRKGK